MEPDNLKITTHERIDTDKEDLCRGKMGLNGNHLQGSSWVGYVPSNSGYVLCTDCALEEYDESHISDNYDGVVQETSEVDYPGFICDQCHNKLDTHLLVYREQDPKLWHQIVWNEQLGNLSDPVFDDEKLAKQGEIEAYELGYAEGNMMENSITQEEKEENPYSTEYPTDSANYANNIAPELRAMSGYIDDMGRGTYQEPFRDVSYHTFNEGVSPAFHAGYYDRIMTNREKWDSWEKHDIEV